jgi:hypothetical protein
MATPVEPLSRPSRLYDLRGTRSAPDLTTLSVEEAELVRTRLHELDHACGCGLGSAVALVALAAYITVLEIGTGLLADSRWISVGVGGMVFVLAAGAGKTLGQIRARKQRDRLIDDVHWRTATARSQSVAG